MILSPVSGPSPVSTASRCNAALESTVGYNTDGSLLWCSDSQWFTLSISDAITVGGLVVGQWDEFAYVEEDLDLTEQVELALESF